MTTRKVDRASPSGRKTGFQGSVAFDAANCPAATVTLQSVTIPEVKPGDVIFLVPRASFATVTSGVGYCLVAGTAIVPFINPTAATAENPASQTYDYAVIRPLA